jgi:arylsulfatase A-like enzyme
MKALVIVADGFHLGYAGCYGNEWILTPNLDRFAAAGVVFDQHLADQPDAAGARRAWRTGCHQLPGPGAGGSLAPMSFDLIRTLTEHGVATALVTDGERPDTHDFALGWQQVLMIGPPHEEGATALDEALEVTVEALEGLASRDQWLLWLDLAALLPPWALTGKYRDLYLHDEIDNEETEEADEEPGDEIPLTAWTDPLPEWVDPADEATFLRLQRSYAGMVTLLDAGLGLLLDELTDRRLLDDLAVIVTSGHGLALGEHGLAGADLPWLHEERIHVPLIVHLPGSAEAGRRVPALTQGVDLLPTLLDLFHLRWPAVHGHSLMPLCRGEREAVRAYACCGWQRGESVEWALRTPEWNFILPLNGQALGPPRGPQLYVKPDDRWEVNNVCQHHPELSAYLEQTLRGFVEATRRPGTLQAPELCDLEAERAGETVPVAELPPHSSKVDENP